METWQGVPLSLDCGHHISLSKAYYTANFVLITLLFVDFGASLYSSYRCWSKRITQRSVPFGTLSFCATWLDWAANAIFFYLKVWSSETATIGTDFWVSVFFALTVLFKLVQEQASTWEILDHLVALTTPKELALSFAKKTMCANCFLFILLVTQTHLDHSQGPIENGQYAIILLRLVVAIAWAVFIFKSKLELQRCLDYALTMFCNQPTLTPDQQRTKVRAKMLRDHTAKVHAATSTSAVVWIFSGFPVFVRYTWLFYIVVMYYRVVSHASRLYVEEHTVERVLASAPPRQTRRRVKNGRFY